MTASEWLDKYGLRGSILEVTGLSDSTPEHASYVVYCVLGSHLHYEGDLDYWRRENPEATQEDVEGFHEMTQEGQKYLDWIIKEVDESRQAIDDLTEEVSWTNEEMYPPREHELKVWPAFYDAIAKGDKTFEVRKNDRDFQYRDVLYLRRWDPDSKMYTGEEMRRRVTYIMHGGRFGLEQGYVVMSHVPLDE